MKIAIFGDVHGNFYGFQSVIEDIQKEQPDKVYCTGDLLIPYPGSQKVWKTINRLKIPLVRGNGEDRLVRYFSNDQQYLTRTKVRFKPSWISASTLNPKIKDKLQKLPLKIMIDGPDNTKILICHGTPYSNVDFLIHPDGIPLENSLRNLPFDVIVAGHNHEANLIEANGSLFITTGSAGMALEGKPVVKYLILAYDNGKWKARHKSINYNSKLLIQEFLEINYLEKGGPLSWLIFDEVLSHRDRYATFLVNYCPKPYPKTEEEWEKVCKNYLKSIGRWKYVKKYLVQ